MFFCALCGHYLELCYIGIVTNMLSDSEDQYLIVHNIGAGTRIEDVVFAWTIKGHYRFF